MDRLTQALLSTSKSANDYNNEVYNNFKQKQAEDAANYEEQWRPDIGKTLLGAGLAFIPGMQGAGLGMAAGGLLNKKAVNKLGGSVQGPQEDFSQLFSGMNSGGQNKSLEELLRSLQGGSDIVTPGGGIA